VPVAQRGPSGPCLRSTRGACLAVGLWLTGALGAAACDATPWQGVAMDGSLAQNDAAGGPVAAWYEDPTTRYAHGVLGDAVEAGTLAVQLTSDCRVGRITLPHAEVFEDIAPRLADLDGDGRAEVIVVHSHRDRGARLAVYAATPDGSALQLAAATPHIGRTNRWLAPVGTADLDGDGAIEIAYVDRPHLARTLRVWRYLPEGPGQGRLVELAALEGLTNHRIGEDFISGGLRDCGTGPEMITADARWSRVMATRLEGAGLTTRPLGRWSATAAADALACRD
jgi:hypothetical protein